MKIALLGAAGGIGQALSLLLTTQLPRGAQLALYDVAPVTPGIAVDLSHIPSDVQVTGFVGDDIAPALTGADVVVICAGVARKPGMDRADLFAINAGIVKNLVTHCATHCPNAWLAIVTNPVNTTVAIAAEVLKQAGVYNPQRLLGVTTLDVLRTETFVKAHLQLADCPTIPVIGGHSGTTILPLLSQVNGLDADAIPALTSRIQNAGTEVVNAKAGAGSATLSMAQAACRITLGMVKALQGIETVECAYVAGDQATAFFAQPVRFGKAGIVAHLPFGPLSAYEQAALDAMQATLHADIELGVAFVQQPS